MNFASTYELAAGNARLAELHRQADQARTLRLAKKERARRKGA